MFDRLFETHPKIEDNDNEFIDFSTKSISYNNDTPIIQEKVAITDDAICRDDIINQSVYSETDESWAPLVFSGIDNPFSIDYNDIVWCPELNYMINQLNNKVDKNLDEIGKQVRRQYIDKGKKFSKDISQLNYSQRVKSKLDKLNNEVLNLPPNFKQDINESDITKDNLNNYWIIL